MNCLPIQRLWPSLPSQQHQKQQQEPPRQQLKSVPLEPPKSNPQQPEKAPDAWRNHVPNNKRAPDSFRARPFSPSGEVRDINGGHTPAKTRHQYSEKSTFTAVVAACCTFFLQWNDVFLHLLFRPLLAKEVRRRLRLLPHTGTVLTELQWLELLLISICVVWFNPAFLPVAQTQRQFRSLGLTLPSDGSRDTEELKVKLFDLEVNASRVAVMAERRLNVLRQELQEELAAKAVVKPE
jgi:hypothetical protein